MRLVDANKLDFSVVKYLGEFCHVPFDDIISGWKEIVDAQPTAYDVDKIVEELENPNNYTIVAGKHFTLVDRSVEIVRAGLKV